MYKSCLIGKCWIEEFHSQSGMQGWCIACSIDRLVLIWVVHWLIDPGCVIHPLISIASGQSPYLFDS